MNLYICISCKEDVQYKACELFYGVLVLQAQEVTTSILISGCFKIRPIKFSYALCCFAWLDIRVTRGPQIGRHDDLHTSHVPPPTDKRAASHRACLGPRLCWISWFGLYGCVWPMCSSDKERNGEGVSARCGTDKQAAMKFIANLVSILSDQCKNLCTW